MIIFLLTPDDGSRSSFRNVVYTEQTLGSIAYHIRVITATLQNQDE
jgi:hypothetical protein